MAITISSKSPIKTTTGTFYINSELFDPRLFFTHTASLLYYMVSIKVGTEYYIIANGKLQAYNTGTSNQYKFDFGNYIKINNQINLSDIVGVSSGLFRYDGYNKCSLWFHYSTTEIYNTNLTLGKLLVKSNNDVVINTGYNPTTLTQEGYTAYEFKDTVEYDDSYIMLPTIPLAYRDYYYPIIVNRGYKIRYTITPDIGSDIINTVSSTIAYDYTLFLINIPSNSAYFSWTLLTDISGPTGLSKFYDTTCNEGVNHYYYLSSTGMFDVLHCTGSRNILDTVSRDTIELKNKTAITSLTSQKQIKQNTGFNITDTQMREVLKAPFLYNFRADTLTRYKLENTDFTGYNGVKLGEKNIELILTDPKSYKRSTNHVTTFFE